MINSHSWLYIALPLPLYISWLNIRRRELLKVTYYDEQQSMVKIKHQKTTSNSRGLKTSNKSITKLPTFLNFRISFRLSWQRLKKETTTNMKSPTRQLSVFSTHTLLNLVH